jgi:transcriptional regulator with XRE-family HTH domain
VTKTLPPRSRPLHERIVWARKQQGISQERFAELIGTTRRHMIRIEKGTHRPRRELLARIAEAAGVPEDFFDDDEEPG